MTITLTERVDSRTVQDKPLQLEVRYTLSGTADEVEAYSYARAGTAAAWFTMSQTLYRQQIKVEPRGHTVWIVSVTYGQEKNQTGEFDFEFDTSGGTVRITQAKSTTSYPVGAAPDHKDAIDVDGDQVRGVDIVIPALKMTYSFKWPAGAVNEAFARTIARATGKTNSAAWHGFAAGELLFLGATGRSGSDAETTITYHMAASENASGLTFGDVANVAKKGWEAVWITYEPAEDGGEPVRQPEFVYVCRVYDEMNFATTLGF